MKWEVLVNDDRSDPPLKTVLKELRAGCGLVNDVRQGWPENWNKTPEKARGAWVHMLHHDDLAIGEFAATMWKLIRRNPQAAYVHSAIQGRVLHEPLAGRLLRLVATRNEERRGPVRSRLQGGARRGSPRALPGRAHRHDRRPAERRPDDPGFPQGTLEHGRRRVRRALAKVGDVVFCPQALCLSTHHSAQLSLSTWLQANFLQDYLHVHEEGLKALGPAATDADRDAMHWRIACAACGVARARAMAGDLPLAREALADAAQAFTEDRRNIAVSPQQTDRKQPRGAISLSLPDRRRQTKKCKRRVTLLNPSSRKAMTPDQLIELLDNGGSNPEDRKRF